MRKIAFSTFRWITNAVKRVILYKKNKFGILFFRNSRGDILNRYFCKREMNRS